MIEKGELPESLQFWKWGVQIFLEIKKWGFRET
jgi:hypothetical protein